MLQTIFVTLCWLSGAFAYFLIFFLFITSFEKCEKPTRADVRATPLHVSDPKSIEPFQSPEEDIVYAGIRKSNQLLTCNFSKKNPLQAIIVSLVAIASICILLTALSIQAAIQISRDIAVKTVNDIALKSQVDDNIICADARFKTLFDNNILARPSAYRYKTDAQDFFPYSYIEEPESLSDCSTFLIY